MCLVCSILCSNDRPEPLPCSYNDWEWAVADFAIVRAGLVSVGVHGTYQYIEALGVLRKAEAKALCCMSA